MSPSNLAVTNNTRRLNPRSAFRLALDHDRCLADWSIGAIIRVKSVSVSDTPNGPRERPSDAVITVDGIV